MKVYIVLCDYSESYSEYGTGEDDKFIDVFGDKESAINLARKLATKEYNRLSDGEVETGDIGAYKSKYEETDNAFSATVLAIGYYSWALGKYVPYDEDDIEIQEQYTYRVVEREVK